MVDHIDGAAFRGRLSATGVSLARVVAWRSDAPVPVVVACFPDWGQLLNEDAAIVLPTLGPRDVRARLKYGVAKSDGAVYDHAWEGGGLNAFPPEMAVPANGFIWRGVASSIELDIRLASGTILLTAYCMRDIAGAAMGRARQWANPSFAGSLATWIPHGATRMRCAEWPAAGATITFFDPAQVQGGLVASLFTIPAAAMTDWIPIDTRAAAWLQDVASIALLTKVVMEFE